MKLVEVIEPEERVTLVVGIAEHWFDPRLSWNPKKYGNISKFNIRQDKVWSPTLTAFEVNELVDFRDQDFRMVGVESTGHVYTRVTALLSINCAMRVSRFPFDSQTCQIKFCVPIFYASEVEVLNEIYHGIANKSSWSRMGNSEWKLVNLTNRVDMLTYNDDGFGSLELAVFEFKVRRNPLYYIYMIVFPSFIINTLSIIGVFMKNSDTMSKLNVGLTNIMTMTFILGVMADMIPKSGSIPLLGVYIIVNLFIMIVAVGVTIGILELRKCAVPRLVKRKNKQSDRLLCFMGDPLETTCAILLELLTIINFTMMIVIWLTDS